MILRDFTRDDQATVRALVLDGLRGRWGDSYDDALNPDVQDISETYMAKGNEVVVLELEGQVVGTGILIDHGNGRGQVVRMSVASSLRRSGLGRRVLEELVARARRRGLTLLEVETDTPWESAVAFYAACGFAETHRDPVAVRFERNLLGDRPDQT